MCSSGADGRCTISEGGAAGSSGSGSTGAPASSAPMDCGSSAPGVCDPDAAGQYVERNPVSEAQHVYVEFQGGPATVAKVVPKVLSKCGPGCARLARFFERGEQFDDRMALRFNDAVTNFGSALFHRIPSAVGWGRLSRASQFGIRSYERLRVLLANTGLAAHHLYPQRFAAVLGVRVQQMASVAVTRAEHQIFTNAWRTMIPYGAGTANATRQQVENAASFIYAAHPALLHGKGL